MGQNGELDMRFVLIAALMLGACATPYQEIGLNGGTTAEQVSADTWRIMSRGNVATSKATVADYAMLKAAEITRQHGGTHFIVLSTADAANDDIGTPALLRDYRPQSAKIYKPGQDTVVRVLVVKSGSQPPAGAMNAEEVLRITGARVERG